MSKISHLAALLAVLGWTAGWSIAGWGLSAVGCLDRSGVALAFGPVALLALYGWRLGHAAGAAGGWVRWTRFRRNGWAQSFALLFGLAAAGGLLAEPNNFDALSYRFPRLFHWVAAGHWHWIDTQNLRQNYSATASEWLLLPGWAAFHSVRAVVIANLAAFGFLPGLFFSAMRRLGVRGRIARVWMWLLPAGYGYLLQAGSAGNDLFGAALFLAALDLVLRSRQRPGLPGVSLVAMALATGVKLSNLPLLLPWAVAAWPARRQFARPAVLAALLAGAVVSAGPTLLLNRNMTGDFAGDPANSGKLKPLSPAAALAGNTLAAGVQNLTPPIWPLAGAWNTFSERRLLPALNWMTSGLPRFTLRTGELAQEEWSGLGLPLILLLAAAWSGRRVAPAPAESSAAVLGCGLAAAGVFGLLLGSEAPARLLLPYYVLGGVAVLRRVDPGGSMARPWWRMLAGGSQLLAGLVLLLSPARPLWPWRPALELAARQAPHSGLLARAQRVYSIYHDRADCLAPLRAAWPPGEKRIGLVAGVDDAEASLWRPFGRVEVVTATRLERLTPAAAGVRFLVVRVGAAPPELSDDLASAERGGKITRVLEARLAVKAAAPAETWTVWRWPD